MSAPATAPATKPLSASALPFVDSGMYTVGTAAAAAASPHVYTVPAQVVEYLPAPYSGPLTPIAAPEPVLSDQYKYTDHRDTRFYPTPTAPSAPEPDVPAQDERTGAEELPAMPEDQKVYNAGLVEYRVAGITALNNDLLKEAVGRILRVVRERLKIGIVGCPIEYETDVTTFVDGFMAHSEQARLREKELQEEQDRQLAAQVAEEERNRMIQMDHDGMLAAQLASADLPSVQASREAKEALRPRVREQQTAVPTGSSIASLKPPKRATTPAAKKAAQQLKQVRFEAATRYVQVASAAADQCPRYVSSEYPEPSVYRHIDDDPHNYCAPSAYTPEPAARAVSGAVRAVSGAAPAADQRPRYAAPTAFAKPVVDFTKAKTKAECLASYEQLSSAMAAARASEFSYTYMHLPA